MLAFLDNDLSLTALRTFFLDVLSELTFRVAAATNECSELPVPTGQDALAAFRAFSSLRRVFGDLGFIALAFDVLCEIALGKSTTSKKCSVLSLTVCQNAIVALGTLT